MKFFVFLLLVTLINLSVANGQETEQETACRTWKQDPTTDFKKIMGDWYTFLADIHFMKKNELCHEYTFTWDNSTKLVSLVNTQHQKDKSHKIVKGRAHKTQFPGVFDVVYENGLILEIYVVAMSEDFIIFAGCFKDNSIYFFSHNFEKKNYN